MKSLMFLLLIAYIAHMAVTNAVIKVRAVEHGDAIIPCGQSKIFLDGPEAFVSWLKDDRRVVYRFPIKDTNNDEKSFNDICYRTPDIKPCQERTSLFLPRVTKDDAGFYRCRIHYNASPAVDFDFHLTIVETPGHPKVFINETPLDEDYIGPIGLGSDITMVCEVRHSSREKSVVQWEHDGQKIAGSKLVEPDLYRAVLNLRAVQRDQHGARYACIVQPADVTPPLIKEVEIKMKLPPLSLKIVLDQKEGLEPDTPKVVDCIIIGFTPVPTVQWFLDNKLLKTDDYQGHPENNVTLSTLTFVPKHTDNGRTLTCHAKNGNFQQIFSTAIKIKIAMQPTCVGSRQIITLKPYEKMKKIACIVNSYSKPTNFTWEFTNNKALTSGIQDKDIPTRFESTLKLPMHSDENNINITCKATNSYGEQKIPCEFIIQKAECNNAMDDKVPCNHDYDVNENTNNTEKTISVLDFGEGSHAIETEVAPLKDNSTWWISSIFLLGSTFLLGIVGYVMYRAFRCTARTFLGRKDWIGPRERRDLDQRALTPEGQYHREPDVVENRPNQRTLVSIIPTAATTSVTYSCMDAMYGENGEAICTCNEIQSYCV